MARFTSASGDGSGTPGPAGDSAYEIAVNNGFEGTEEEWLASLNGTDSHGNFSFVSDTLEVRDSLMNLKAYGADEVTLRGEVVLNPASDSSRFRVYDDQTQQSFSTSDWATATWTSTGETSSQLVLAGASGVFDYFDISLRDFNQAISINGNTPGKLDGWGGNGTDITIYILDMPVDTDPTVTTLDVYSAYASTVLLDYDDNEMRFDAQNMHINMTTTGSRDINLTSADDLTLTALGDDITIRAKDDIVFRTGYNTENTQYEWRMESNGRLEFPGQGYIINPSGSSGESSLNDTFRIVPDNDLIGNDQYLIIDPTSGSPNHIHLRAGGAQDYSNADIILGGERAGVRVSDTDGTTVVQAKQEDYVWTYPNVNSNEGSVYVIATEMAEPDINDFMIVDGVKYIITSVTRDEENGTTSYETTPSFNFITNNDYTFIRDNGNYMWTFNTNGYITGPAMGNLRVTGIINDDGDLYVQSDQDVVIGGGEDNGEYLNDSSDPDNQIATIGDISDATPTETSFTVNGGTLGDQPTFTGDPLFSGSYVKTGPLVHFQIQVDMDNITNFGTGQYYVDLPFDAKYGYQIKEGCLHDVSTGNQYAIGGHVLAGENRLVLTYTNSNGQDEPFDHNSPITLTTADNFHVAGTYISE
jgi:hypothetical protein